jgi:hypothetical protein
VSPPAGDAAFAARMEDILAVYARPPDPRRPLVCLDEVPVALHADARPPQGAVPGRPARQDSEYVRGGSANVFLACAPHLGWRDGQATAHRTAVDFARAVRTLLDGPFAAADGIVLVTDNLNPHTPAAFYRAFPPAEARRLLARIEWHYTPTHGSWLNLAEIELSVLTRQCLDRRLPDRTTLERELAAWVAARNAARTPITWRFTLEVARLRLAHVYPEVDHGSIA